MEKLTTFDTKTDKGVFLYTVGEGRDRGFLEKTASAEFHPEIAKYIADAKPIPGFTQVLLTALGAGEFWGNNKNGDFFPEEALKNPTPEYGYKTFEHYAKVYKHHVNKADSQSYGRVVLSVWNEKMKRVELIVMLDHGTSGDLVERINNGEYLPVSMGCKVPYDVCSICGNKAPQRKLYCDHLRYYMGRIPPGHDKKAVAINTKPRFFDLSFVFIGADSIARVMKKVASVGHHSMPTEKSAAHKIAEIEKEVSGNIEPETLRTIEEGSKVMRENEPEFPKKTIIQMGSSGPSGMDTVNRIMSTLAFMGILPKPPEFQSIVLRALGHAGLAEDYEREGITFSPHTELSPQSIAKCHQMLQIRPCHFDDGVFSHASPFIGQKSYATPILHKRIIILTKMAADGTLKFPKMDKYAAEEDSKKVGLLPMMALLTGLHMALSSSTPAAQLTGLDKLLADKGKLALLLGLTAGGAMGLKALFGRSVSGKYDSNPDKPSINTSSTWQQNLADRANNPIQKFAELRMPSTLSRIAFGVPTIYALSGIQEVKRQRDPYAKENPVLGFIRKHPDLASIGLVGGPLIPKAFKKTGSMLGAVGSAAVVAASNPGASLANRIAAYGIDNAFFEGLTSLGKLKRKKQGVV